LSRKERAAFETLKWLNERVADTLGVGVRELRPGKHKAKGFVAWTDGKTYICANRGHLRKFEWGLNGTHEWVLTLVHEYTHDTDDSESHSHGEVFYRKFHDSVFAAPSLGTLAQSGLAQYLQNLQSLGLPKPQKLTRQLKPLLSKPN
jgi:hypothetical protein